MKRSSVDNVVSMLSIVWKFSDLVVLHSQPVPIYMLNAPFE